jgi:hypothetical protein
MLLPLQPEQQFCQGQARFFTIHLHYRKLYLSEAETFFTQVSWDEGLADTENETRSIIHSLKAKNTSGFDGITSKILKVCSSLISHPLTHICNHLLFMGIFPECLKISVVTLKNVSVVTEIILWQVKEESFQTCWHLNGLHEGKFHFPYMHFV